MKKIITLLIMLIFSLGVNSLYADVVVLPANKDAAKSKKEIRKADKQEKKIKKVERMIEKAQKKAASKTGKKKGAMAADDDSFSSLPKNLRLAIIFAIAAVGASVLSAIIPGSLWYLASILWLIALVFVILWLINDA